MEEKHIIAALEIEIAKSKKRLDAVYIDVEELKRNKLILENDSARIQKHNNYLEELGHQKQSEIDRKEETIKGLDSQIRDKQNQFDTLQHEVNGVSTILSEKKQELVDTEQKILEHTDRISLESVSSSELHKMANERHAVVEDKLKKLTDFLNEIQ